MVLTTKEPIDFHATESPDELQPDRFDLYKETKRVGAHRANPNLGSRKTRFLLAALATMLLIFAGVLMIQLQPGSTKYSEEIASEPVVEKKAPVVGVLDPEASVVVLNGTSVDDLAFFVDDEITNEGWGKIVFSGDADSADVATSAIFFSSPSDEAAAVALGEKLGGVKAYLSPNYSLWDNQLTVLLGSDYRGPGFENAQNGEHPRSAEGLSLTPEEDYDPDAVYEEDNYYEEPYEYEYDEGYIEG